MALWEVAFPVNYTSSGDLTRHAIEKHIKEIDKIYRHLNKLRNFSASSQAPLSPDNHDIWLKLPEMELLIYLEGSGWLSLIKVKLSERSGDSDKLAGIPAENYATKTDLAITEGKINEASNATDEDLLELKNYVDIQMLSLLSSSSFVFTGAWQDGGGYVPYNVVEYLGSSYILKEGDGLVPPPASPPWQLVAQAGAANYVDVIDGGRAGTTQFVGTIGGGGAAI